MLPRSDLPIIGGLESIGQQMVLHFGGAIRLTRPHAPLKSSTPLLKCNAATAMAFTGEPSTLFVFTDYTTLLAVRIHCHQHRFRVLNVTPHLWKSEPRVVCEIWPSFNHSDSVVCKAVVISSGSCELWLIGNKPGEAVMLRDNIDLASDFHPRMNSVVYPARTLEEGGAIVDNLNTGERRKLSISGQPPILVRFGACGKLLHWTESLTKEAHHIRVVDHAINKEVSLIKGSYGGVGHSEYGLAIVHADETLLLYRDDFASVCEVISVGAVAVTDVTTCVAPVVPRWSRDGRYLSFALRGWHSTQSARRTSRPIDGPAFESMLYNYILDMRDRCIYQVDCLVETIRWCP